MFMISGYNAVDKAFDLNYFTSKLSNIFRRLKLALSDGKLEEMQPYLTDGCFKKLSDDLSAYASKGRLVYTERMTVLGADARGFEQSDGYDFITADVRCRIVEYVIDIKSRKTVSGNDSENFVTYSVVLKRKSGLTTAQTKGINAQNCPYCGAPVNINKSTKCDYCGRVLNTDLFDWQIDSFSVH